jgi:hypothetical protein
MKTILFFLVLSLLFSLSSFAQDMQPPPPIDDEFFNNSVGDWVSEEYEMMGMKWTDEINVSWALGKQFLVISSKSKSDKGMNYESIGYVTMDKDKNAKMWFFDNWGMDGVSEFTGKIEGNTQTMEGGSKWMKSSGTITIDNGVMTQQMKFTMPGPEDKSVTQELKVVYKKK